jgi:hypothetical protein
MNIQRHPFFAVLLHACAAALLLAGPGMAAAQTRPPAGSIELPLVSGWYDGRAVYYVTTDVSDPQAAQEMGVNYVPRLADAIPPQPPYPGQRSAVEHIYSFGNFRQGGVLPSIPMPAGAGNRNRNYSPFWLVHKVNWLPGHTPRVLKSEEAILAAADNGEVTVTPTRIVVNCPVIFSEQGGLLKGAKINLRQ